MSESLTYNGKKSVYVIYYHKKLTGYKGPVYAIYAFHVPKNSTDVPPAPAQLSQLRPVITFREYSFPCCLGFGVVGSSIYMIGHDVLILDTKDIASATSPRHLDGPGHSLLRRGPLLNTPKANPIVVSLLGKIFAIPRNFSDRPGNRTECLYPNSKKWICIPNPTLHNKDFHTEFHSVDSCNVVGSRILVLMYLGPVYELDGNDPSTGWKKNLTFSFYQRFRWAISFQAVGGFWFPWDSIERLDRRGACLHAIDVGKRQLGLLVSDFPLTVPHPSGAKIGGEIKVGQRRMLDIGDGLYIIFSCGNALVARNTCELKLRFSFDVVRFLNPFDGKDVKVPIWPFKTVLVKSFDYVIGEFKWNESGVPCACIPMMAGDEFVADAVVARPVIGMYLEGCL